MIEQNLGDVLSNAIYLSELAKIVADGSHELVVAAGTAEIYIEACQNLVVSLSSFDLKATDRALSRLIGNLQKRRETFTFGDFIGRVNDLILRMRDELEMTKCFVLESSKINFFAPDRPLFGESVAVNYPSAYLEILEAAKCLALGRATASVFHLMRTLEVGIKAIAAGLKIPDPVKPAERSWAIILRKIDEAIKARPKWSPKSLKQFYEESHASLDAVRNPWRNTTMHVEKTYTEDEAEHLFHIVKGFMMKLATKIDEDGKPIRAPKKPSPSANALTAFLEASEQS